MPDYIEELNEGQRNAVLYNCLLYTSFNARNQGTIGSYGDPNYLLFRWNWVSGAYNLMELEFYDGGIH